MTHRVSYQEMPELEERLKELGIEYSSVRMRDDLVFLRVRNKYHRFMQIMQPAGEPYYWVRVNGVARSGVPFDRVIHYIDEFCL